MAISYTPGPSGVITADLIAAIQAEIDAQNSATGTSLQTQIDATQAQLALTESTLQNQITSNDADIVATRAGFIHAEDRPGDNVLMFSGNLSGAGIDRTPLAAVSVETNDLGEVYNVTGAGYILARNPVAISQDVIEVLARVRRKADPEDPSNHAVELVAVWLDRDKAVISETALAQNLSLLQSDGLVEFSTRISALPAAQNVIAPPAGTVYATLGIRQYGDDGALSVETVRVKEVTDIHGLSQFDLSQVVADAEAATTAANNAVASLDFTTVDGWGDVAVTDLSTVGTVVVRYGTVEHDGRGGVFAKDVTDTTSAHNPPEVLVSSDGSRFRQVYHEFDNAADVISSAAPSYPDGTVLRTLSEGFAYEVVSAANDLTTGGGVLLSVLPGAAGVDVRAFGAVLDGSADDATPLQAALNSGKPVRSGVIATAAIETTLTVPGTAKDVDFGSATIFQSNGAELSTMVALAGYGNDYGVFKARVDGNRANNTALVTGVATAGTFAGDRIILDVAGKECDTLFQVATEVEHCEIKALGQECGTVLEVSSTSNTPDDNKIYAKGYRSNRIFKTVGTNKTSGTLEVHGEVIDDWAIEFTNGWYTVTGLVRGCGVTSGGGCVITSTATGRIAFQGLQLYGQTPAPNNSTWGLLVIAPETWLEGNLILGAFDGGAWITTCKTGSNLRINVTAAAANQDGVKLGDFAGTRLIDGCTFSLSVAGAPAAAAAVNLDNIRNSLILLEQECNGDGTDIVIGANSFDNEIRIGRRIATSRTFQNNRTQVDNTIIFEGSYTWGDLQSINGGTFFDGMQAQDVRDSTGFRSSAYYSSARGGWLTHTQPSIETSASLADATNHINTDFKTDGRIVLNGTDDTLYVALGSGPTDIWQNTAGGADITPA